MSPEAENLFTYRILESINKWKRDDHHGYADNRSRYGQPDNKSGEGFLLIESNTPCNETGYIHNKNSYNQRLEQTIRRLTSSGM